MTNKYVVRSRSLRQYLQSKGFECEVDMDRNNTKYDVFLFNDSKLLRDEITNFTKQLNELKETQSNKYIIKL